MEKRTVLCLITLCVIVSSCTRQQTTTGEKHEPTPAASTQVSPPSEASGGFAPPEAGDTSAEEFTGTTGILEEKKPQAQVVILREVRTGRHETYDRVVFEFSGAQLPGYHIEYLDKPARACGSGEVVAVAGQGRLLVQMMPAHAHDEKGQPTVSERERRPNLPLLKQMKLICDFEADVQWVLGLAKPNGFRVVELTNPARLVVDVKH